MVVLAHELALTDEDLELGVALGLGGCFGAGFAFAFAFAVASSFLHQIGRNRSVSDCHHMGLCHMKSPTSDVGPRAALRCCDSLIASKSLMISGRGSCIMPFCRIKCITAIRRTCGRHAQMMSTASRGTVFR